jgi:hypothetical protein
VKREALPQNQGDQIGRFFAVWAIVNLGYLKNPTKAAQLEGYIFPEK